MNILGIDTSTSNLSVAVLDGSGLIAEYSKYLDRQTSQLLLPTIKKMLRKAQLSLDSIDTFAVGLGPGSFTGLRIGVSAIKGLSFACSKPIVGIPTLDVLALNVFPNQHQICPIVDARQNKVYVCLYKTENNKLKKQTNYLLTDIDSLLKKIKKTTVFLGDGLDIYQKIIKKTIGKRAIFADKNFWYPRAGNLALLAKKCYNTQKKIDPKKIVPLYLYPKECQIKKRKRI